MAKVIKAFHGAKDGEVYPQDIQEGEEITGDLARVAIEEGWAEPGEGEAPAEKKARKNAPENK
jgi:hypothetical protein